MVKKAFYLKGDQYLDNNTQRKPNTTIYLLACKNGIRHLGRTLHMTNPTFPIYLHENELQEIASGQSVIFYMEHEISLFCVFSSKTPHSSEKGFSFMKNRIIGQDLMMYGLQTRK